MLKEGDFVKIKDGIELETGEYTQNWAGEIIDIQQENHITYCLVHLDAITINELSDEYIQDSVINEVKANEYNFEESDLLPSDRRDTEQERATALKGLGAKICLLYTSPSPRDATLSRMPSSA